MSACSQSRRHIRTSTISLVKEVLFSSSIIPAILNADSDETVNSEIVKTSHAKRESMRNLACRVCHYCKY